jgi:hypothetical protein
MKDRARQNLERALSAEILAGRRPACPDRDAILAGPQGPLTAEVRERVLEHADGCATCGSEVSRNVSATRVFALLPAPALTPQDRAEVLATLSGLRPPAPFVPVPAVPAQGRSVSARRWLLMSGPLSLPSASLRLPFTLRRYPSLAAVPPAQPSPYLRPRPPFRPHP